MMFNFPTSEVLCLRAGNFPQFFNTGGDKEGAATVSVSHAVIFAIIVLIAFTGTLQDTQNQYKSGPEKLVYLFSFFFKFKVTNNTLRFFPFFGTSSHVYKETIFIFKKFKYSHFGHGSF